MNDQAARELLTQMVARPDMARVVIAAVGANLRLATMLKLNEVYLAFSMGVRFGKKAIRRQRRRVRYANRQLRRAAQAL